jgi:hypothetical protein
MARLGRKGRTLKWAGLILSQLIAILGFVSFAWAWEGAVSNTFLTLNRGLLGCVRAQGIQGICPQWRFGRAEGIGDAPIFKPVYGSLSALGEFYVVAPLWMLFLIAALPTAFLWWLDRRRIPLGHCQKCGYNLTGNVSGICPECGQKLNGTTA